MCCKILSQPFDEACACVAAVLGCREGGWAGEADWKKRGSRTGKIDMCGDRRWCVSAFV